MTRHEKVIARPRILRSAALAGVLHYCLIVSVLGGCSAVDETYVDMASSPIEEDAVLGSIDLALTVGSDVSLDALEWRVEGNGYAGTGEVAVGRRPIAVARLGGIPIGEGYTLWLGKTDATMSCGGSATFGVRRSSTTAVRVEVQCTLTATTGQVTLTAPINVCPLVRGLSATPLELEIGETAQLRADATDIDEGPGRAVVRWESDGAMFTSNGLEASLTCVAVGQSIVRVFISDGACEANAAVALSCVAVQQRRFTWPGAAAVAAVDPTATFVSNISGAAYQPGAGAGPGTLWVVQNGPSRIFPMYPRTEGESSVYALATEGPWRAGKFMTYPDGGGEPDAESLTFAGTWDTVYVATERNNAQSGVSRLSILRISLDDDEPVLLASHEWNVTAQLPRVGANAGLEGITWIPDEYLLRHGFFDEQTGAAYDPNVYPDHADGLFFVGVEADGMIHALALNHGSGEATRVARFSSGHPQVMDLQFDRDSGLLWALCDDTCQGEMTVLGIVSSSVRGSAGRFQVFDAFSRPSGLPNVNNEGLAITPDVECSGGLKPVFWVDDSSSGGHAVRRGLMPCGALH